MRSRADSLLAPGDRVLTNARIPARAGLQTWLLQHEQQVGNGFLPGLPAGPGITPAPAQVRSAIDKNIASYYGDYTAAEISAGTAPSASRRCRPGR